MAYIERVDAQLVDNAGNAVEVGLFGGLKTSSSVPQISMTFDRAIDAFHNAVITGSNVEYQYNRSLLRVGQGSTHTTTRHLRYKTAQTIETYFTAAWQGVPTAGNTLIGLYDSYDGVYLGYKDGAFVVGYRNVFGSSSASWDGASVLNPVADVVYVVDMSKYDLTRLFRFRIKFGYLGIGNISYEIFDGYKWEILHTFITDGTLLNRTHVGSAILPMRAETESTLGVAIISGSWNAQTYGLDTGLQDEPFFSNGIRNLAPTTTGAPLIAFRSKKVFGNYPSKIRSRLLTAEFATGSEGLYNMEFYTFPAGTIAGTATWTDIDTHSVLQQSVNITIGNIVGGLGAGKKVFATTLTVGTKSIDSSMADFERLGLVASPGEEFVVVMTEVIPGVGTDITTWSIAFEDLF